MDHDFLGRFIEKFPGATERLVCLPFDGEFRKFRMEGKR